MEPQVQKFDHRGFTYGIIEAQERFLVWRSKLAIKVRATEFLLYLDMKT